MARNPFWTWSLRLYRRPGVAPACLALQDRAGVDVNLLLFCLWAGRQGMALPPLTITAALAVSRQCQAVIAPLRKARRAVKPLGAQSLRAAILGLELQAERLEQDALHALARAVRGGSGERAMLAADNLAAYFRRAGIMLTRRDWPALRAVVRSAFT